MKITYLIFVFFILAHTVAKAQQSNQFYIDSLKHELTILKEDTNKVKTLNSISSIYQGSFADTGLNYGKQALALAQKLNFETGIFWSMVNITGNLATLGNYPLQLDYDFKALALAKKINQPLEIAFANGLLSDCYYNLHEYNTSLKYWRVSVKISEQYYPDASYFMWFNFSRIFEGIGKSDSALYYAKKSYEAIKRLPDFPPKSVILPILGNAFAGKAEYDSALFYYKMGIPVSTNMHQEIDLIDNYNGIASVYKLKGNIDSSEYYAKKTLNEKITKNYPVGLLKAANILTDIYQLQNKPDSTLKYLRIALTIKDSLFSREKTNAIQNIAFKEQEKQKEIEAAKLQSQNQLKMYALLGGLFTVLVIAVILFRNNKQKQKANIKIENAYAELKSTQAQLIQSEKMASLGELTAGIAHEIQNPLNFVNNFSEVNKEMLEELKAERSKPNAERDDDLQNDLINDVIANEEKINHHGKRADAIVKGMLQHSRQTSGTKEPTDINALCDEYLRLSYHGLRAKDKNFNADYKTDFDNSIGKINIVAQDIGRVLLNLINNAFYAVNEKKKLLANGYQPMAEVKTRRINDKVEIIVSDNGNGIPQNIVDKIFQPFFTTKPTGEGTGLGLSLAYDIITKEHNGTIKVESKEGEGTKLIITLPV